jgi:hypothetical protein
MTDYEKQGEDFLKETRTTFEVVKTVPQKSPLWCKDGENHGIHYAVTLKNERYSYTFDYWGSISDAEYAAKPNAYDVLSCLDVLYSDTFEDFCADFDYDVDSIKAEKTYIAMQEQDRALRRLFTMEQLEKLQEIF